MTIFGLDISHHQGTAPDLAQARREGIEFVFIKSTEGASFVDDRFAANLAEARDAGMLVAAYHYVRAADSIQSQVANVKRVVPRDVPVIPDVEAGSGDIPRVKTFVGLLREAGYRVPLSYIPRWYWQQVGSPDLRGLPPLWSSRYPDTMVGDLAGEWSRVPTSYWTGYGGLEVAVLQFSSSARVAGHAPLDANAYRGTRDGLSQLLYGTKEVPDVKNKLVREAGKPTVWFGDGLIRRWVKDEKTLADYQWQMEQEGLDPTVQEWRNIDVLGAPLESLVGELTNDEANILAALRALPAPGDIDEEALAATLAPLVGPLIQAGATPDQVEAAMRRVFASAGHDPEDEMTFPMPDLRGLTAEDAKKALGRTGWLGVWTARTGGEARDPGELNKTIDQKPAPGEDILRVTSVEVTIATKIAIGG
jgi:glycosyl hydrolase family 25/PASTA domain-containing protein